MKIIVIGYGRVGSQFIRKIDTEAHQVVVVDKERSALERAKPPEGIRFIYGNAIDEDLLRDAGAESADILLALTRDENTNLMLAQIARVIFNIPRVVAIVYDPDRESYFHEAGIETLAITAAGADILTAGLTGAAGEIRHALGRAASGSEHQPAHGPASAGSARRFVLRSGGGRRAGGLLPGPLAAEERT